MKKISFLFFVMFALVMPNLVQAQDLVITEIMYNPPEGGTDTLEYVEIYNASAAPINMDGYTFSAGITYTFGNVTLNNGDYFVIAIDSVAIGNVFGTNADAQFVGGFNNGGEVITLQNNMGVTVDEVSYDDSGVWPSGSGAGLPDGGGSSLQLCDVLSDNTDGSNWSASTAGSGVIVNGFEVLGTPGTASTGCPCINTTASITESVCITYTVPSGDETYTTSGIYNDTVPNAAGCDSVITIDLTINSPSSSTDVVTACDTYTWIDGMTYTSSNNTATFTDMTVAGCDSIITLDLTINTSNGSTDVQAPGCGPFTWIDGNTYAVSNNTATFTYANANAAGCDSIVTLDLTLNTSAITADVIAACDTYTWIDGITYTSSNNTATFTETNIAGCDSIIALDLTINTFTTGSETISSCITYTVPSGDETYTASGIYNDTVLNAAGCDSIITIDLTITSPNGSTDVITACDTYTWIDGMTYTSSNTTATFTDMNIAGCDSIITLDLTINTSNGSTDVQAPGCGPFTWIDGNTYAVSNNTATFTYPNANVSGCDSIVTLDLTLTSSEGSETIVACNSYTVPSGDETITTSGIYMDTLQNAAMCDSIITLDVTINVFTTGSETIIACDSYTVPSGDETYTASGIYMDTIPNAAMCDSIITLDVTINLSNGSTDVITACDTYTWIDGMTYTSTNNTATFTETNIAGCDSIVSLDLTINNSTGSTDVHAPGCGPFTWIDGNTYALSNNTATFTYTNGNAVGCDSIVTLDLTLTSSAGSATIVECNSYTVPSGDETITTSGIYMDTLQNAVMCDSIITLDVTINVFTTSSETITACGSYIVPSGDETYTASGIYMDTIPNAVMCDSIITIDLTVIPEAAPILDSTSLMDITDECSVASIPAPTASDECSGSLVGVPDVTFPITAQGTTVVTWTFTDGVGNAITQSQNVIIEDLTPPTASNPNGITVQCSADVPVQNPAFVTDEADNCSTPVVAFVSDVSDGQTCPETITRTFSVTDAVGLTINVTQTIIVSDVVAPLADDNALATLTDLCSVTPAVPTATDACSGIVNGTADVTFPITALGVTTITWTYVDDCGNQSTQTQDVNIVGIDVTTSIANDNITIVSNNYTPGSGITYQWINCSADTLLTGETNHNFTPTYSSDFAVIITENGCTDTSACVTVTEVGLKDLTLGSLELYPNPNSGTFTIKMTDFQGETAFKIVDMLGKEILNSVLVSESTVVELDVEPGVYFIVLKEGTQRMVVR